MKNSLFVILALVVVGLIGFVGYQYAKSGRGYMPAPGSGTQVTQPTGGFPTNSTPATQAAIPGEIALSISAPLNNSTVTSANISVSGKTVPNADVAVNDKELKADASGNFVTTITLDEGENTIGVVASDANGKSTELDLMVTYTPAQ